VIAVLDEVRRADLVQLHRRHTAAGRVQVDRRNVLPARPETFLRWQEGAGEVPVASYTADDLRQRDVLHAPVERMAEVEPLLDLVEVKQTGLLAGKGRGEPELVEAGLAPRPRPLLPGFRAIPL